MKDKKNIYIEKEIAVSPADCRLHVFTSVSEATRLWIKGKKFSLKELIQDDSYAQMFEGGSIVICRLAPQDYHRFHSPGTHLLSLFITRIS